MRVCAAHVSLPTALLTTCASSRLSLESSALCVDSAARTPLLSVTPLSFSPSVGGHVRRERGLGSLHGTAPAAGRPLGAAGSPAPLWYPTPHLECGGQALLPHPT